MNEIINFWNIIVESNTFNFVVLLIIFAVLFKKLNIANTVEKIKQDIVKAIDDAKFEREQAKNKLLNAQKSVEQLDDEIKNRLKDAKSRAESLSSQIMENAENQVYMIRKNLDRIISAEEKTLSSQMSDKALKSAIELAKQQIIRTLENKPELHNKFIDESIGEI